MRLISSLKSPVSRILSGSVVGQGLVLLASPILTRLYSPSDFAAFSTLTAIGAIIGGFATLSWERATPIPRSDTTARSLVVLGAISSVAVSVVVALVALLAGPWLSVVLKSWVFDEYWWLLPSTVLAIAGYGLLSSWLVRVQDYSSLAYRNGLLGAAQSVFAVGAGLLGMVPLGLLLSTAIGRIVTFFGMVRKFTKGSPVGPALGELKRTCHDYRRFPLVNTWSRLANAIGLHFPIVLIVGLYGGFDAGMFALTMRVLAAPVGMVVDAASQWFEGMFAARIRDGDYRQGHVIKTFVRRMFVIGLAPTVVIVALGPSIFELVFGPDWRAAGVYAQLFSLAHLAQFSIAPISRALVILGWQGTQLLWDVTRASSMLGAIVVVAQMELPFIWCVGVLMVVQVAAYVLLFLMSLRAVRHPKAQSRHV